MLSYETGGITLRNDPVNNNNSSNVNSTSKNDGYSISQQQPIAQSAAAQSIARRVPGAPPKRRVPGAPPVKKNLRSLNTLNQQANITIPNNIESMNTNTINNNPILKRTIGSIAKRVQQPKRRVPGAPSTFNMHTNKFVDNSNLQNQKIIKEERIVAQKANKFSVYTIAERNLEEYKRKQDEREGIVRNKPKGWARVKKHVEWKPGFHCAVCMTGHVTGRLKPCGHRAICNQCYEEYISEGRGVNCPQCFDDVKKLLPDSVESSDSEIDDYSGNNDMYRGNSDYSSDEEYEPYGPNIDYDKAKDHLDLNLAGKKFGHAGASLLGTTVTECGHNFGAGVGMALLNLGYLNMFFVLLIMGNLFTFFTHLRGTRPENGPAAYFVTSTMGNCGVSNCNVEKKVFAIFVDAVIIGVLILGFIWTRTKLYVFSHHIGDPITLIAERTMLVTGLSPMTSEREARVHFGSFGAIDKIEFVTDLDSKMLALLYDRRDTVTNLRLCEAKAEFGDRRAQCSGDCISEQEWGEMRIPTHENRLKYIEANLEKLVENPAKNLSAFVWFKTKKDRNHAVVQMRKFGWGGWVGSLFAMSGFTMRGLGNRGVVTVHPGLYPSNILHHNIAVSEYGRYFFRFLCLFVICLITFSVCGIYANTNLKKDPLGSAILLYISNVMLAFFIRKIIKRERKYLQTDTNDATCKLTYFGMLFNILYMTLYSAFYSSRDGGVAKFHTLFRRTWYDYGGGEIIHFYLCFDSVCEPLLLFIIAAYRANWRQRVMYHAVSQEQLNRAHNGMKLDVCLEHSRAMISPSLAILFCLGMPITVGIVWVGICFKQLAIRYILFYHARIPLWRDGASVHWDLSCLKICGIFHFLFSWAMCAGADTSQVEEKGDTMPSVGVYVIPIFGFLGSSGLIMFASTVTPCIKRCLQRTTNIVAPVDDEHSKYGDLSLDESEIYNKPMDIDFEANLHEMQRTALEAFDSDFIINPKLYVSFDPTEHPIFGAEIRMRRATVVNQRQNRAQKELDQKNKELAEEKRRRDKELLARQKLRAEEAKARLHDYVESMARKKENDQDKMRKRAEAKKKRRKQQKTKRTRAKRLYDMDRSGQNFIV
jgi:hypothetical protein